MDVRRFKELCQRLDELAAILEIMECDPINADLHREASNALSQALSEIERLRSDADQHRETPDALNQALSENERLRSDADQHRETSNALNQALSEIERLRSNADQHRETSNALRDALAENERVRSDAADLRRTEFDLGLSNLPPASIAADWFMKFSERKQALIGEKVRGRKSDTE
jgi:predicted ribosome quality control (RQC) complex YloA/Tae2 family protein